MLRRFSEEVATDEFKRWIMGGIVPRVGDARQRLSLASATARIRLATCFIPVAALTALNAECTRRWRFPEGVAEGLDGEIDASTRS